MVLAVVVVVGSIVVELVEDVLVLVDVVEEVLLEVMYDLPSRADVTRCLVDRDVVLRKVAPTLLTGDESRRSA